MQIKKSRREEKYLEICKEEIIYGTFAVHNDITYYIQDGYATAIPQNTVAIDTQPFSVKLVKSEAPNSGHASSRTLKWLEEDQLRIGEYKEDRERKIQKTNIEDSGISSFF